MKAVTSKSFEQEVTKSSIPVVVDFWAPWCGPCKALLPVLEKIEAEYSGKVKFVSCDVSDSRDFGDIVIHGLPLRELITTVPYLLIIRNGVVKESFPHSPSPIILRAAINKVIA